MDREKELAKVLAELKPIEADLARSQAKLANEQFTSKAPAAVIEKERRIVVELEEKRQALLERKASLQ